MPSSGASGIQRVQGTPSVHHPAVSEQSRIIDALTVRIEEDMWPFRAARDFPATIPAVSPKVADVIIVKAAADIAGFATPAGSRPGPGSVPAPTNQQDGSNPYILPSLGFNVTNTPASAA